MSLTLKNCRVYDVDSGQLGELTSIKVVGAHIESVGGRGLEDPPATALGPELRGSAHAHSGESPTLIDLAGGVVMPGLIDAHVHLVAGTADLSGLRLWSPSYAALHARIRMESSLRAGFTRVRDVGGADWGLARAAHEHLVASPAVHYGGLALSQTGGHGDMRLVGEDCDCTSTPGISRVVNGVDDLRVVVREQVRLGASHIKLMLSGGVASPTDRMDRSQYSEPEIKAVVDEAQRAGIYVAGHCYTSEAISRAVKCGVRSIEHGNRADNATLDLMANSETFLVPTLSTYYYLGRNGQNVDLPASSLAKLGGIFEDGLDCIARAVAAGVKVAFGTDLIGPLHAYQSQEFAIRGTVLPMAEVIRSATVVNAELLGIETEVGRVLPGYRADLIAIDGDPSKHPSPLADPDDHLRLVIRDGNVVFSR